MNSPLLVTIVTPSYNQGQFIEETILSVLNQTYKNIQYIIVDGGSADSTMAVVNRYKDKIDIVIYEKDKGQSDAINKGFRLAKGALVGWINSDDILYPDCVEEIVKLYQKNTDGSIFCSSTINIIDVHGKFIKEYSNMIPNRDFLLRKRYSVCQQGSFYSNEFLKKVDYLDEGIFYCMDLDLWLKLLNYGPIYQIDYKILAGFREWATAKTSAGGAKFLSEIRKVLIRNGATVFDWTVIMTYWYELKSRIKSKIRNN